MFCPPGKDYKKNYATCVGRRVNCAAKAESQANTPLTTARDRKGEKKPLQRKKKKNFNEIN